MRKILSSLASFALAVALAPVPAFAQEVERAPVSEQAQEAVQTPAPNQAQEAAPAPVSEQAQGQIVSEGGSAEVETEAGGTISISKIVEPTDVENYFDITLRADVEELIKDSSTAVVLVMDVSNTMNEPQSDGSQQSRLQSAQDAANAFVQKYCEGEGLSPDRQLGVVTFNTNAQWAEGLEMQSVESGSTAALQSSIAAITAPSSPNEVRFTNMEAGLQLAFNALDEMDAAHKYVVFLTDGFPTTYIDRSIEGNAESDEAISGYDPYEPGAYNASKVGEDGYFADAVKGLPCTYGTSYSDKAAQRAADVALVMKSGGVAGEGSDTGGARAGINIFSVGIDIGGQTIAEYLDRVTGTFSVVDRTSDEYEIGAADDADAYAEWLGSTIAGGPSVTDESPAYANGNSEEELNAAFGAILEDIKETTGMMLAKALTIDPMGEHVQFQYFYDADGSPADELAGEYGQGSSEAPAENTAMFLDENESIVWNLLESGHDVTVDDGGTRAFHFDLRYRVRLENEMPGFPFGAAVDTNDGAVLEYQVVDGDGEETPLERLEYPTPQVKGYAGSLVIEKVDALVPDKPVEGAVFELSHSDECEQCAAAKEQAAGAGDEDQAVVVSTLVGISDAEGMVRFDGVPSGHGYVLRETEAAEGYLPAEASYDVEVGYGATSVQGASGGTLVVENVPEETPPVPYVPEDNPPSDPSGNDPDPGSSLNQTGDDAHAAALAALAALFLGAVFAGVLIGCRKLHGCDGKMAV